MAEEGKTRRHREKKKTDIPGKGKKGAECSKIRRGGQGGRKKGLGTHPGQKEVAQVKFFPNRKSEKKTSGEETRSTMQERGRHEERPQ